MGNLAIISLVALQVNAPQTALFTDTKTAAAVETQQNRAKVELSAEMRGDIAMARKDYRLAIDHFATLQPPSHIILNKLGIAYHQFSDLDNAAKFYQRAIRIKRDYPDVINNLGTIFYARKSYRRAVSHYNRALKLTPNSASIHGNLGMAWFARMNYQKASEEFQKALAIDPEVFEHRGANGVLFQERSVSERAKFHYYLARTYAKAGAHDRALQYMRKALEEGFKERNRFVEEPEFAAIRQLPEFKELIASNPRVL